MHIFYHLVFPAHEVTGLNVPAGLAHQPEIKAEVVQAGDLSPQQFLAVDQVPKVSLIIETAGMAGAIFVYWAEVVLPLGVLDVDNPPGGVQ